MFAVLITSCDQSQTTIDISNSELEVQFNRLDKELFSDKEPIATKLPALNKKYGVFFQRYTEDVLNLGAIGDPTLPGAFKQFIYDTDINRVAKEAIAKYEDMSMEQEAIENAFKRYHILFPSKPVPEVTTIISGFTYKMITTEQTVGIGLDMYLGANYPYYSALQFPQYRKQTMERTSISSDVLKAWVSTEFLKPDSNNTMLDEILYEGKILYLLDALFPKLNDAIKIGYTEKQLNWCISNEMPIWGHFVNENLLFSKIKGDYFKYVNDGPFTAGFDRASPARTGHWIGWNIIRSYMENNPETSIADLMKNKDAQGILNNSNYKPKK